MLRRLLVVGSCGLSTAIPLVPEVARCLRVADHDFDRLFADQLDGSGNAGRRATEADCDHACNDASSKHHAWCIGFEFRETEKGMCEMYDDCSQAVASPAASPVKEAQAAPAAKEAQAAPPKPARCLRVADHEFDSLFADQVDKSGNVGRKATEADCSYACNDASSEHHSWCIGFEFRDTETGMCEMYDDCSKKAVAPSPSETAKEHSTPFATQAAQEAPAEAAPAEAAQEAPAEEAPAEEAPAEEAPAEAASSGVSRCLRVADHEFDSSFIDQGRKATEADCSHLCSDESSDKHTWCVGFEFKDTEKGTCELYDECTEAVAKERKEAAAKEAAVTAAPAKKLQAAQTDARCLRVSDHEFDRWFVEHYDKDGHRPGRKATEEDCSHVCSDASSEHATWCVGFEFKDTEKSTCELYAAGACSQQQQG